MAIRNLVSSFTRKQTSVKAAHSRKRARLRLEELETRIVPTALLILDFDGASMQEVQTASASLTPAPDFVPPVGEMSFVGELTVLNTMYGGYDKYSWLDLNNDRILDRLDGDLAATEIIARVQRDYEAYDVQVVREDDTNRALAMTNNGIGGDTLVLVSGYHSLTDMGYGGQAPGGDFNNTRDDLVHAGASVNVARRIVNNGLTGQAARDAYFIAHANVISHEAGHSFGLQHHDQTAVNSGSLLCWSSRPPWKRYSTYNMASCQCTDWQCSIRGAILILDFGREDRKILTFPSNREA